MPRSFSSALITAASSAAGSRTSGATSANVGALAVTCMARILAMSWATNGFRPVSSSYSITPQEYRSARASTSWAVACSGDM